MGIPKGNKNFSTYWLLGGLSLITFALGVGRWSEKHVVFYIKVQIRDICGQKIPKNANVICKRPLSKMNSCKHSVEPSKSTLATICSSCLWSKSKHTCIIQSNQVLGFDWFFPLFWLFLSIYVGFHLLNHGIVSINCLCAPKIKIKIKNQKKGTF